MASEDRSAARIDDREWVAWGFTNLTLPEALRRLRAVNADRKARGEQPLGEPPFTGASSAATTEANCMKISCNDRPISEWYTSSRYDWFMLGIVLGAAWAALVWWLFT
jgi:hypothetical protein